MGIEVIWKLCLCLPFLISLLTFSNTLVRGKLGLSFSSSTPQVSGNCTVLQPGALGQLKPMLSSHRSSPKQCFSIPGLLSCKAKFFRSLFNWLFIPLPARPKLSDLAHREWKAACQQFAKVSLRDCEGSLGVWEPVCHLHRWITLFFLDWLEDEPEKIP